MMYAEPLEEKGRAEPAEMNLSGTARRRRKPRIDPLGAITQGSCPKAASSRAREAMWSFTPPGTSHA